MPDSTINYAFPYPVGGDAVAVHSDVEKLAKSVDAAVAPLASTQYVDDAVEAATATVTYVGDGVYDIS